MGTGGLAARTVAPAVPYPDPPLQPLPQLNEVPGYPGITVIATGSFGAFAATLTGMLKLVPLLGTVKTEGDTPAAAKVTVGFEPKLVPVIVTGKPVLPAGHMGGFTLVMVAPGYPVTETLWEADTLHCPDWESKVTSRYPDPPVASAETIELTEELGLNPLRVQLYAPTLASPFTTPLQE